MTNVNEFTQLEKQENSATIWFQILFVKFDIS